MLRMWIVLNLNSQHQIDSYEGWKEMKEIKFEEVDTSNKELLNTLKEVSGSLKQSIDRKETIFEAMLSELTKIRHDVNIIYSIILLFFILLIISTIVTVSIFTTFL